MGMFRRLFGGKAGAAERSAMAAKAANLTAPSPRKPTFAEAVPTWGALDRPNAMSAREGESALAKFPRVRVRGAQFMVAENCLRLVLLNEIENLLNGLGSLDAGASFVLLTRPASEANAVLLWRPGQQDIAGLSPDGSDGSRVSGSCLLIAKGRGADEIRPFEDGYSIRFSDESWAKFQESLLARRPLSLPMGDGMFFELELPSERT